MSHRDLPWQTEAAIIRDVYRWADTTAEASPRHFGLVRRVMRHGTPDQYPWRASAWFTQPKSKIDVRVTPGAPAYRVGRGATPEAAIVDLAYILHEDFGFYFPAMPEEVAR